jgi:hypothetical protein
MSALETTEHGIQAAYYNNGPNGLEPTLECLCGEVCAGFDWSEAGTVLDEHLKSIYRFTDSMRRERAT